MWVLGYCGIQSDEVTDELARYGANQSCQRDKSYLRTASKHTDGDQLTGWNTEY